MLYPNHPARCNSLPYMNFKSTALHALQHQIIIQQTTSTLPCTRESIRHRHFATRNAMFNDALRPHWRSSNSCDGFDAHAHTSKLQPCDHFPAHVKRECWVASSFAIDNKWGWSGDGDRERARESEEKTLGYATSSKKTSQTHLETP